MVAAPVLMPVTMPLLPAVAIEVLLLVHVPPGVAELSHAVEPTHKVFGPAMVAGIERTVITAVLIQPVGKT